MSVDKPDGEAKLWFVNATNREIDFYLNSAVEPEESDVEPLSLGSHVTIAGDEESPFQVYTVQARAKDDPEGPILAEASVDLKPGTAFDAVLHPVGDGRYGMAIYSFDFCPSAGGGLEVRQASKSNFVRWQLFSTPGGDADIPEDKRRGVLNRSYCQQATEITPNEYTIEALVRGRVVARCRDLDIEPGKTVVAYLVGDPKAKRNSDEEKAKWLFRDVEVPGRSKGEKTTTPPKPPFSVENTKEAVRLCVRDATFTETERASVAVLAWDPDGYITSFEVVGLSPEEGDAQISDELVALSRGRGWLAAAEVEIGRALPPGTYELTLSVNGEGRGERALETIRLTINPVTIDHLLAELERYEDSKEIPPELGRQLRRNLRRAEEFKAKANIKEACRALKRFASLIEEAGDAKFSEKMAADLERKVDALRDRMNCG